MWREESWNQATGNEGALTVGLDGTPLAGPVGGIRRFTSELLRALESAFPADRFLALSDQFEPKPASWERWWWLLGLNQRLRRERASLFHGTDFAVPYWPRIPSVLTLHDLSPWRDPAPLSARVRRRTGMLLRWRIPTLVHTPSEAVRREAIQYFGLPESYVVAIPLAAGEQFRPTPIETREPYFLYLGALEERKNLEVLITAARELWAEGLSFELHFAGLAREGFQLSSCAGVRLLGEQREEVIAALYSNCVASLYPSRYEGFGLPVLEAMQCGAGVIASRLPVLEEVGGEAAVYADAQSPAEWAAAMRRFLLDTQWRRERQAAGLQRAAQFSWGQTARRMRQLYDQALR